MDQRHPPVPINAQDSKNRPIIALLTDFGLSDGYVGVMKGVIASIAPHTQCIDITHDSAPQNIAEAAWILATSYHYFPRGTIFVCVVDPGVGSSRKAIAVHAGDWLFVGPNNGLFSYVYNEQLVHAAVVLTNAAFHLPQVSTTFHGRDIFAPVAAHLARGTLLDELGLSLDPTTLQHLNIRPPIHHGTNGETHIEGHIAHVDHFGNLITNIPVSMVPHLFTVPAVQAIFPQQSQEKSTLPITRRQHFFAGAAESDSPFIYVDSSGYLAIAVHNGNAAQLLGKCCGATMTLVIREK